MKQPGLQRVGRIRVGRIIAGDENPLRRHVDRIESAITVGLVVAFLIAAPLLSFFAVRAVGAAGARERQVQRGWTRVQAVLNESAEAGLIGLDGEWDTSWVTAHWTMPTGVQQTGYIAVALNARADQRMTVWVTPAGQLTHPPLTRAEVGQREVMAAIATPAGVAVLLLVAAGAVRVLANRRRVAGWTREWDATGPRWSSLR
jgi:hypothetical protein